MGKIKKVPSERHNATASPAVTDFVTEASSVPLHRLWAKLSEFPSHWPHPRGDLYHWIPLLDRFDHILELFNQEYGLDVGPQTQPFECRLLEKGDSEESKPSADTIVVKQELYDMGYAVDGDLGLIIHILRFTRLLLERCGNRSLYASSGHINHLLHTTSLSLLRAALQLSLRLAQRYQVARYKNTHPQAQPGLLANHYNINLDNMHKLAMPFPKPRSSTLVSLHTPSKTKDKAAATTVSFNPADLVALTKNNYSNAVSKELRTVVVTYMDTPASGDAAPPTPTPSRRTTSSSSLQRPYAGSRTTSTSSVLDTPTKSRDFYFPATQPKTYEFSANDVVSKEPYELVKEGLPHIPKEFHYELLYRVRLASAFASHAGATRALLEIRLLAIANMAYALSESRFQERIGLMDSNEARPFRLASQLCDLLQPGSGLLSLSIEHKTIVLETIEALARCKHKSGEIVDALAVTVNHGVLYYELRHAISSLKIEADPSEEAELHRIQWRNAVFDLVTTVSQITNHVKCAEKMVAAGIMEILVEALTLRTSSAERVYEKIMGFLTSFVHGITTAFQALASKRGLEIITELASYEVTLAMQRVRNGEGMPARSKSKVVDYSIPYYQQATLRSVFKFIVYLFDHNSGVHDRLLRNLLDSPQTLGALREIIANANIFGSNVWDAAINTVSNFIHNEPTSYQVIAEAGLAKGILEAVTQQPLTDISKDVELTRKYDPAVNDLHVVDGQIQYPIAAGILPVSETICDIPAAFGAICLNEEGMSMFQASGALDAYLDIFLSPAHVRALEEEGQTALSIGSAFDELSRHHPSLQEQILNAVVRTLKRVRSLASLPQLASSATLQAGLAVQNDQEMSDASGTNSTTKQLVNRAPAIPFISAFFKFLEGFFHNSSMCQKFCTANAAVDILDLITSAANPYDLSVFPVIGKMANVYCRMAEEKAHLVVPGLVARVLETAERLDDLSNSQENESYFHAFTSSEQVVQANKQRDLAKVLANVCALSIILSRVLNVPSYGSRGNNNNQVLVNLNLADMYAKLIKCLGKLHSACLLESISLSDNTSETWKPYTEPEALSVRNVDAEGVIHTNVHCAHCAYEGMEGKDTLIASFDGEHRSAKILAFKNTRLLRFLLGQVPTNIGILFQSLSQTLAPKRSAGEMQKYHVANMAESLASAIKQWFQHDWIEPPALKARLKYDNANLAAINKIFLRTASNMESFVSKEVCTLALSKFFNAKGFEQLHSCQTSLVSILAGDESVDKEDREAAEHGLDTVLSFYAHVCRSKCINDAAQSSVISVRSTDQADFFMPHQFLVELRYTVIKSILKLWTSDDISKIGINNTRLVVEIMRNVFKAEGEDRAIRRSDNATRKVFTSEPPFQRQHYDKLTKIMKDHGIEYVLARESIYRCYNNESQAIEYCQLMIDHGGPGFPLPNAWTKDVPESSEAGTEEPTITVTAETFGQRSDHDDSMSEDENLGSLGRLPGDVARQDITSMGGADLFPASMLLGESALPKRKFRDTGESFITMDDLSDERDSIRQDLIDRCLEILSSQTAITFELADLIQAAVGKATEASNPRADWGNTLVSSLLSLQPDGTEATGQKIAAYAHLVALILQDHSFFTTTLDELKDNFDSLVSWIQFGPEQNAENSPWVEMILLIIERVLAEDEQPARIEWVSSSSDDVPKAVPVPSYPEQHVSDELRVTLFNTVVDILPKIGKQHTLALSVCRVLVILSRRRDLAVRLCDKLNLSRLFLMIRQLATPIQDKMQSSFMLILRHLIEDEETIRQTMRTEIRTSFDSARHGKPIEATTYVRNLHHLILREPRIFVEVTKEMVEIADYSGLHGRSHQPVLKLQATASEPNAQRENQEEQGTSKAISAEGRLTTADSSDGVIQFLLRELSNYKDVEDKSVASKPPGEDNTSSTDAAKIDNPDAEPDSKNDRPAFEPKDNVIYIYRCFIMQCLAELLACYGRTKLDFINFSRKAETQNATPSKPRSGTINYLLHQLLPVGTLEHRDTIEHRKRVATSEWATVLLVALCSQTHEKPYYERHPSRDSQLIQEDADLTFVRRFVLEHALRSFKEALIPSEPEDMRYSRLLALADLFDRMLSAKPDRQNPVQSAVFARQSLQIGRLMYEKHFIIALTSSIAELDLNFPNSKRAVKHILGPLKTLTDLAVDLSQRGEVSSGDLSSSMDEDGISSATSVSEDNEGDEEREQTPDLFRNSTLSMFEASGAHDDESESEEGEIEDEDEEMFESGFDEEMDYEDGNGETISDDSNDEIEGMEGIDEMGELEGLPGDMEMELEIVEGDSETTDSGASGDEDESSESDDHDDHDDHTIAGYFDDMEEINGDDENASIGDLHGVMHEGGWEESADFEHGLPGADGESPDIEPLERLANIIGADDRSELEAHGIVAPGELDHGHYFEDEMAPDDDDDDEDDDEDEGEEEDFDAEFAYEPEIEEDEEGEGGWGFDYFQPPGSFMRRPHRHRGLEDIIGRAGARDRRIAVFPDRRTHQHHHHHNPRAEDEGLNPLLQRNESGLSGRGSRDANRDGSRFASSIAASQLPAAFRRTANMLGGGPHGMFHQSMFHELVAVMDRTGVGQALSDPITITMDTNGMRDPLRLWTGAALSSMRQGGHSGPTEEAMAVEFKPSFTSTRWEEEARMLFGVEGEGKAQRIINTILSILVPPAIEAKRIKDAEEAERKAAEEKAREETYKAEADKAHREALEKQQREKEEEEAATARHSAESAAADTADEQGGTAENDTQMSGTSTEQAATDTADPPEPAAPRITTTIRGQEVDITNLGIDHEYLQALPEEFREEVIMAQFAEQRSQVHTQAQQAGEAPNEINREFLEALPPEIQTELLRQEAIERRRRERAEARRQAAESGPPQPPQGQDMEAVDFLAMLDPGLRQQILLDAHQDENYMNALPEEVQREARALLGADEFRAMARAPHIDHPRLVNINGPAAPGEPAPDKARTRPVVQMLDKAGVPTLLRLMFITLQQTAKSSLLGILSDVCKNTQNRAEVISILLTILQDGTADVNAVERSFAQLSLRAKQVSGLKTPQPLKRTLTNQLVQPVTELSPLNIVQQCLSTLHALSADNPKVQTFFLSEHENMASQKSKNTKKGKAKEIAAAKYPLNALLTLLDRKLITENTSVMETLAALLSRVTSPLQILLKKAKQAQESGERPQNTAASTSQAAEDAPSDQMEMSIADVRMQEASAPAVQAATTDEQTEKKKRSLRELEAPSVPEENIRLVVNILAARECPSKTFSDTLDIIKHMAAIPGAKEVFGRELIHQASELGGSVVSDLDELTEQINDAQTGAEVQGVALVSFSSAGSKQRKLLRILVALDHLFDPKRMAVFQNGSQSADVKLKEDILASLYESETFQSLWKNLSLCLTAIRQRGDLVNVATVLLPLIESLMVVCRNSSLRDAAISTSQNEVTVGTPPPEARIEGLFFTFTEDHRKILNELIRNNPKLMNGNLSILAKNSKVLEFDNKRSYFTRKLHNRDVEVRVQHPALTLNVRRDEVFMDSYKALFFKSGEEIKNGKLNIHFNGEEGIDAGGVSREWFAVMARQMFNPNFALFNPVASDRTTFHPNRLSDINEEHLPFFKFIGRVIGKALYEGRVLDCHFSRAVYRRILGKPVSLKDMESLDLDYYKSLVWILENDITDITFETFSTEVDRFGEIEIVDLVPNGRDIPVTEDNKQEYVRLVVEHRLIKSVEEQLNSFLKGFHEIIPAELVAIFNEQELELLISGLPDIDVDDWKNNTEYHNYQATSAQIQWFWRAIKSFDPEERAKLLQFVTGTSKVPLNGFKELEGMNGFARFNIHRDYSSKEKLPTSHTCFNQLDLPEYESYEHLRQQLYTAITAGSEYFGFA